MTQRVCTLACLAILVGAPSAAQTADQERATFRSGVDLVRFDVRVVDESGRPVTDLRADEFEILENGRPRPILLFQRVTEPAGAYVDAAIKAVSAEVSSNEAFPRGHLYILIFDQQHITPGNEQRARLAAQGFIRTRVRPSDRVALFALPGPGPQIGFTSDKLRVIKELSSIRGAYRRTVTTAVGTMSLYEAHRVLQNDERLIREVIPRMSTEAGADVSTNPQAAAGGLGADPAMARRLLQENARTIVNQSDSESRQFLQRLADVVMSFRDIDGRKTVVLFSEGFFPDNLSREIESVAAAAAQSYSVFYTFDLNGRGPALDEAHTPSTVLASEIQSRIAPMGTLATETDGSLILDAASRSGSALDAIADQTQDYYLVGFEPSETARANRGKYHRVTVRVKRSDARTSARTGYALPPQTVIADRRRAIDTVLGAPFVQQGLKVDYTTYVLKALEPNMHRVVLSLNADLPVRANPTDSADVVFVVRDVRDGRVVASGTDTMALPATTRQGSPLGRGVWRVQFNVPAGSYLMRTVVREPGGLVGSADRRFEVDPVSGPEVALSDLVVGSAIGSLQVRPVAYTEDGLTGFIESYGRAATQMEALDVRVELRAQDADTAVAVASADLQEIEEGADGVSRRARFAVPLDSVAPGRYVARAVVRARGEVVGERTRQVEVVEGRAVISAESGAPLIETVSPADIIRGDLGRRYVAWLRQQAQGTPALQAARRAAEDRWEHVEIELRGLPETGVVAQALRGLALFVREDYGAASAALEAAAAADPSSALTAFFLGWARHGAGDTRAALGAWRSAAHLEPTLVAAHLALADAYLRLAQPALAVQALKAGLAALPDSPELLERLAVIERLPPSSTVMR